MHSHFMIIRLSKVHNIYNKYITFIDLLKIEVIYN